MTKQVTLSRIATAAVLALTLSLVAACSTAGGGDSPTYTSAAPSPSFWALPGGV